MAFRAEAEALGLVVVDRERLFMLEAHHNETCQGGCPLCDAPASAEAEGGEG
jgi:hypothetical protein